MLKLERFGSIIRGRRKLISTYIYTYLLVGIIIRAVITKKTTDLTGKKTINYLGKRTNDSRPMTCFR